MRWFADLVSGSVAFWDDCPTAVWMHGSGGIPPRAGCYRQQQLSIGSDDARATQGRVSEDDGMNLWLAITLALWLQQRPK